MRAQRKWEPWEEQFMRDMAGVLTLTELAERLDGPYTAVCKKGQYMGLGVRARQRAANTWTREPMTPRQLQHLKLLAVAIRQGYDLYHANFAAGRKLRTDKYGYLPRGVLFWRRGRRLEGVGV